MMTTGRNSYSSLDTADGSGWISWLSGRKGNLEVMNSCLKLASKTVWLAWPRFLTLPAAFRRPLPHAGPQKAPAFRHSQRAGGASILSLIIHLFTVLQPLVKPQLSDGRHVCISM